MAGRSGFRGGLAPSVVTAFLLFAVMAGVTLRPDVAAARETPVAAYSFDAGEGTTLEDVVGEHDGTIEGAEWFDNGRYGKALLFEGPETCVTVPHAAELELGEEMTLEAWVKPRALSDQPVIYKSAWGELGYAMGVSFYEYAKFEGLIGEGEGKFENAVSPEAIQKNVWSHLAFTYDGAKMRLYVNGELVATETQSTPPPGGEGPLAIGCNPLYPEDFDGLIDEVRIYDRALPVGEVAADAGDGLQTPSREPVAAYSFDEGEGEVAEDLFGGHDGALQYTEWVRGKFGSALYFDGDGDDFVSIANSADLQLTEEFTLEAWVRPDSARIEAPVIEKRTPSFYSYKLSAGGETAGLPEGFVADEDFSWEEATAEEALPNKTWSHLAMTYDGAAIRLYVDGELVDTNYAPGPQSSTGALLIGADDAEDAFKGRIDEVRIYDRALSAGEVGADKDAPVETPATPPVAAYAFDEGAGETVSDLTGHGHTATIEGAQWSSKGRYGGAMEFDVEDQEDVLKVPDADDLDLTEDFTLEAWVRPLTERDWATVIGKEDDEESSFSYLLYSQAESGGPGVELRKGGTTTEEFAEEALPVEAWSHLALTSDGSKARLYVDGVLVKTSESFALPATDGDLTIGGNGIWGEYFDGRIDEVRIYDRKLSEAEIEADRVSPLQTPQAAPVAAYAFDEGEGSTAEDLSGGGHTATIEGAEWARGRYGSSVKFDGEDMVTIPASEDLNLTEEFTLEAWIKPEAGCEFGQIFVKEDAAEEQSAYVIARHGSRLAAYLGVPGVEAESPPGELELRVWKHVAVTYNGAYVRLYVDGDLVETEPAIDVISTDGALRIGGSELWGPGDEFTGRIDEVRVYNRALSAGEIEGTMSAGLPVAVTEAATGVGSNDAILTGTADANGGETEYFFQYGPTKAYGSAVEGEELGGNRETIEVNEAVTDLAPETTYHYRLVSDSSAGTMYGKDQTFTTLKRTMTVGEEEELSNAESNMELTTAESKAGPGNFFGMMWTGSLTRMKNENIYEAVDRSGAKMLQIALDPKADQGEIAYAFKVADEKGMTVLPGLGGGAFPKAGSEARTEWIEYAKKVVKKYGPDGTYANPAVAWVIWNEPNMFHDVAKADKANFQGTVNPEGFASFFKEMSEALRSASVGEIEVLTPGLYGYRVGGCHPQCHMKPVAFLKQMDEKLAELGYSNAYNAMALHPYVFQIGKRGHQHSPKDAGEVKKVTKVIKSVITDLHKLHTGKPLWITELGFPVSNPAKAGNIPVVSKPIQKLLVKASFSMMKNNRGKLNIPHAFYYNIQDDPTIGNGWEYHSGLLDRAGQARPAWTAYSNLAGGKGCPHAPC